MLTPVPLQLQAYRMMRSVEVQVVVVHKLPKHVCVMIKCQRDFPADLLPRSAKRPCAHNPDHVMQYRGICHPQPARS